MTTEDRGDPRREARTGGPDGPLAGKPGEDSGESIQIFRRPAESGKPEDTLEEEKRLIASASLRPEELADRVDDWLQDFWARCFRDDDAALADAEALQAFRSWATGFRPEELIDPRSALRPSKRRSSQSADVEATVEEPRLEAQLTGRYQEAVIQALIQMQQVAGSPGRVHAFVRDVIAPTIRTWEETGAATPEQMLDLLIMSLQRGGYARVPYTEAYREFIAGLAGFLRSNQPKEERGSGFYATWGGLGDWAARSLHVDALKLACLYYHEILAELVRRPESELLAGWTDIVAAQSNNLAGRIEDLVPGGMRQGGGGFRVLNEVHLLAVICAKDEVHSPERLRSVVEGLGWSRTAREAGTLDQRAMHVITMTNIPVAWVQVAHEALEARWWSTPENSEERLGILSIVAGLFRTCVVEPQAYREIVQTFFNASVSFSIIRRRWRATGREGPSEPAEWLQALCSGTGLWLALHLGDTTAQAFGDLSGIHCAVNFLGSVSDLTWSEAERRDIIGLGLALQREAPPGLETQIFRMENALRDLGRSEASVPLMIGSFEDLRAEFDSTMRRLVERGNAIFEDTEMSWPDRDRETLDIAPRLAALYRTALGNVLGETRLASQFELVEDLLDILGTARANAEQTFRDVYGKYADPDGANPVVRAGALSEGEWLQVQRESYVYPERLSQFVRDHADWIRSV